MRFLPLLLKVPSRSLLPIKPVVFESLSGNGGKGS